MGAGGGQIVLIEGGIAKNRMGAGPAGVATAHPRRLRIERAGGDLLGDGRIPQRLQGAQAQVDQCGGAGIARSGGLHERTERHFGRVGLAGGQRRLGGPDGAPGLPGLILAIGPDAAGAEDGQCDQQSDHDHLAFHPWRLVLPVGFLLIARRPGGPGRKPLKRRNPQPRAEGAARSATGFKPSEGATPLSSSAGGVGDGGPGG